MGTQHEPQAVLGHQYTVLHIQVPANNQIKYPCAPCNGDGSGKPLVGWENGHSRGRCPLP